MNKNDSKDMRRNAPKGNQSGQPEPLSGSKKVKNRNHSRQKHNSHHDMWGKYINLLYYILVNNVAYFKEFYAL